MKWQPIETAPKDRTIIILAHGSHYRELSEVTAGYYSQRHETHPWRHLDTGSHMGEDEINAWHKNHPPTHWMPLPEPPEQENS